MCRPARRSILLYIPYVVKFGQTARAHYANIQEVRNSGAGDVAAWCCGSGPPPGDESGQPSCLVISCTAALYSPCVFIIIIAILRIKLRRHRRGCMQRALHATATATPLPTRRLRAPECTARCQRPRIVAKNNAAARCRYY